MVESTQQIQEGEEKKKGTGRLAHLKQIESVFTAQNYETKQWASDATVGYEKLTFEEKQAQKYFCTFPFPYMNGYFHLGHAYTMSKCEF
jgi:leucyl-tRNA synthetase